MIDQGVWLALALVAVALVLVGGLGIAVSRQTRRDRPVNAARDRIFLGEIRNDDLMKLADAVRDER